MKKLLLASALFLFVYLNPSHAIAQIPSNQFGCIFEPGFGCVVNNSTLDCNAGFEANTATCTSITDLGTCNGTIGTCTQVSNVQCFACQIGQCIPVDPDNFGSCPYTDLASCNIGCTQPINRFKCVNNSCVADPSGPYTSSTECEALCAWGGGGASPTCDAKGQTGIDTAIGCIPVTDTNAFIGFILRWAIGIGGGIAFLLIIYAAFMIMSSRGNPERLKAGQELLTSAIAGLIMLIFSVFILRVIGVDILGILPKK